MHKLSQELLTLIEKECKGRKHLKLTIGTIINGEKNIQVFNETGEIPNENYTYEIGSITKTFAGTLLAKYIHEDKMSLDDSISKYVDGLDEDTYYPTIKRLATHTSGYGFYPFTLRAGIRAFVEPIFTGTRFGGKIPDILNMNEVKMKELILSKKVEDKDYPWAYSNFGIGLVGYAIGVASKKDFQTAMNDYLKNDLGMKNSFVGIKSNINLEGFANKDKKVDNWNFGESVIASCGAISSTADDMLTYAQLQMDDELPYLKLAHEKHAPLNKMSDMGLGWVLKKDSNHVIMHTGGTSGFHNFLVIDKKQKVAYIMLANYLVNLNKFVLTILSDLEKEVNTKKIVL